MSIPTFVLLAFAGWTLRFTFFFVQLICMSWMGGYVAVTVW